MHLYDFFIIIIFILIQNNSMFTKSTYVSTCSIIWIVSIMLADHVGNRFSATDLKIFKIVLDKKNLYSV